MNYLRVSVSYIFKGKKNSNKFQTQLMEDQVK